MGTSALDRSFCNDLPSRMSRPSLKITSIDSTGVRYLQPLDYHEWCVPTIQSPNPTYNCGKFVAKKRRNSRSHLNPIAYLKIWRLDSGKRDDSSERVAAYPSRYVLYPSSWSNLQRSFMASAALSNQLPHFSLRFTKVRFSLWLYVWQRVKCFLQERV